MLITIKTSKNDFIFKILFVYSIFQRDIYPNLYYSILNKINLFTPDSLINILFCLLLFAFLSLFYFK